MCGASSWAVCVCALLTHNIVAVRRHQRISEAERRAGGERRTTTVSLLSLLSLSAPLRTPNSALGSVSAESAVGRVAGDFFRARVSDAEIRVICESRRPTICGIFCCAQNCSRQQQCSLVSFRLSCPGFWANSIDWVCLEFASGDFWPTFGAV